MPGQARREEIDVVRVSSSDRKAGEPFGYRGFQLAREIERTSRLRCPSVTGLSGCAAVIADLLLTPPCAVMMRTRPNSLLRRSSASLSEPALVWDQSLRRWRRHDVHIDHFKPQAGDPLQQPSEGSPIGQLGAENRCTADL